MTRALKLIFVTVIGIFAAALQPASAQGVDYTGKNITIFSGGGGYSVYARLLGQHLGPRLPGAPSVIVKELPGAGTLMVASYLYEAARVDGTEIGLVGGATATAQLFKVPNVRFDPRQFAWIGSIASDVGVVAVAGRSPVKSIKDVFANKMLVGGGGPTSGNVIFPTVTNRLLGTKFEIIRGYKSSEQIALAIERGEVEGVMSWNYSSLSTTHLDRVQDGSIRILLQLALTGHPDLAGIPLVTELARTPEEREILELVFASQTMARPIIAPPKTSAPALAALRKAFGEVLADGKFRDEAKRLHLETDNPMTGDEVQALMARLYSSRPEVVARVNQLMDTQF